MKNLIYNFFSLAFDTKHIQRSRLVEFLVCERDGLLENSMKSMKYSGNEKCKV